MANYIKQISASDQVTKIGTKFKGIFVSAASNTPTITVYDSDKSSNSDPKLVDTFTPVSATNYPIGQTDGVMLSKGLYVVISGTVSCSVVYE